MFVCVYLEKDLDVVDQGPELFIVCPAQLGDECKELCLCCDNKRLCVWVLVDVAENKRAWGKKKKSRNQEIRSMCSQMVSHPFGPGKAGGKKKREGREQEDGLCSASSSHPPAPILTIS